MVNGPHVATAFTGCLKGYKTINETLADNDCMTLIKKFIRKYMTAY